MWSLRIEMRSLNESSGGGDQSRGGPGGFLGKKVSSVWYLAGVEVWESGWQTPVFWRGS